jgi:hypothetical protein
MSALISEAYANPTTPLWGGVVSVPSTTVSTDGGGRTTSYTMSIGDSLTIFDTPALSLVAGMYLATISLDVLLTEKTGTGTNIGLYFQLFDDSSAGFYATGAMIYLDLSLSADQETQITLQLPFLSNGDATDTLSVSMYSAFNYDTTTWSITALSSSLQLVSTSPVSVRNLFT